MSSDLAVKTREPDPLPPEKAPFFSRPSGKIFLIWLAMTVVGVLIGFYAPHHLLPTMLSVEGRAVWATVVLLTVLAAPVAAFVYGVGFYSLVAWRQRGYGQSDEPPPDGPPLRGNSGLTILWLVVSGVLVVVMLVWGLAELASENATHPNSLQVDVTGQQWLWTFSYPGAGNLETRSLVLPDNRTIVFHVTSEDVTHGFWPVELGVQVDANPNVVTTIQATTNKLGAFTVRCSQLCGLYHSFMYASGAVVTPQAFAVWLHAHGASALTASDVARVSSSS
ncbi:MAG: cytochrome c oxidase subunit II [Acidimicrobiales bacterium]|jgi:cytochrome c oxidase subunit 2